MKGRNMIVVRSSFIVDYTKSILLFERKDEFQFGI